jgi:antitoxin (DNA-binding transcriptional repressor) of toxin-antitoxin stability system
MSRPRQPIRMRLRTRAGETGGVIAANGRSATRAVRGQLPKVATRGYPLGMKTAGVKELKNRLSAYLREVKQGETVLVTDNGEVIAELRPPGRGAESELPPDEAGLRRLIAEGRVLPPLVTGGEAPSLPSLQMKKESLTADEFQALLDEAREDRL